MRDNKVGKVSNAHTASPGGQVEAMGTRGERENVRTSSHHTRPSHRLPAAAAATTYPTPALPQPLLGMMMIRAFFSCLSQQTDAHAFCLVAKGWCGYAITPLRGEREHVIDRALHNRCMHRRVLLANPPLLSNPSYHSVL